MAEYFFSGSEQRSLPFSQFPDPKTGRFEAVRTLHESVDILKPPDVVDKYKEVVGHYAKYRQAGMIETEVTASS